MTFPDIDSRDYVTNIESSKPVETPRTVWSVYYQGLSGDWIWSLPTFYKENAIKLAAIYAPHRPVRILRYVLDGEEPVEVPVQKIVKKIRKVRQVIE